MSTLDNDTPPYLDTCSNRLRSEFSDEILFNEWSSSRPLLYSNNFLLNNKYRHECKSGKKIQEYEKLFLFPWERSKAMEKFYVNNNTYNIPIELKPLVDAELANSNRSKDEQVSALLDILGPEYFDTIEELCSHKGKIISLPQSNKQSTCNTPSIPGIYSKLLNDTSGQMIRHSVALPSGTIHECTPGREYFYFPAKVSSADFWLGLKELEVALAFPHPLLAAGGKKLFPYSNLNKMQSIVFPTAFNSNENMLVCAPTGAGKTDVALTAILRVIWSHCQVEVNNTLDSSLVLKLDRNAFKIIYIAPMKALAAEIAAKYQQRLGALGIIVREYTGDMRLSYKELDRSNILISTPEKWDVLTRNPAFADSLLGITVKLIIIDEVHLLQDTRGSVLETIVARTLRYVEGAQRIVRIIGLSATLPNFLEVGEWLRVAVGKGLFFFDSSFRPVPLQVTLIGVSPSILPKTPAIIKEEHQPHSNAQSLKTRPLKVNINYLLDAELIEGVRCVLLGQHQTLVFVHSRSETVRIARLLSSAFGASGLLWKLESCPRVEFSPLRQLLAASSGAVGVHHAGMCRSDRQTIEELFRSRKLSILICTSTLAWGVNLPARAVFIRGTDIFKGASQVNGGSGVWGDLSGLDVLQIFGRAGRPGLDDAGEATLLCSTTSLPSYLLSLSPANTTPIESSFSTNLDTHLNAEINLGTVRSFDDGMSWLSYTFLWVRTRNKGPRGLRSLEEILKSSIDRLLSSSLCTKVFKANSNYFELLPTELGEITSRLYLSVETVNSFCKKLSRLSESMNHLTPKSILTSLVQMFSEAAEFLDAIKMRSATGGDSEEEALLRMLVGPKLWLQRSDLDSSEIRANYSGSWNTSSFGSTDNYCLVPLFDPSVADWTSSSVKVSILFQAYVSGWGDPAASPTKKYIPQFFKSQSNPKHESPDLNYIILNAGRFLRAIFEISLRVTKNLHLSILALDLCKCFENRTWSTHFLSDEICWNSTFILEQAGAAPNSKFISCVESQFNLQSQCYGWSRSSPLQLALFSTLDDNANDTMSINGIPLLSLHNVQARIFQVVKNQMAFELFFNILCHSVKHEEESLWAIISLPHNSEVVWNENFSLSRDQRVLNCRISITISLTLFSESTKPLELNLSILNNSRLGLDVEHGLISLGMFEDDQTEEPRNIFLDPFVNPIGIKKSLPPESFLLGRGTSSLLFPIIQRPFLEVSRICKSPLLQSCLHSQGIFSFSAIQSILARSLLIPFDFQDEQLNWCDGKSLIIIIAPFHSGKTLTAELAIWGAINSNNKTKILVIVPNSSVSNRLIKRWSFQDSIPGILGLTPSSSIDNSIVVLTPLEVLKLNASILTSNYGNPLLVIAMDVELVGDDPSYEISLTLLRYWTHCDPICRWIVLGRPFASVDDLASWLSFGKENSNKKIVSGASKQIINTWSLFCGPEVSLIPLPLISIKSTNRMPGTIATEISKAISPDALLVVWVYSKRFCRVLASKLSVLLAQSQIGIYDESVFSFKDELLHRTVSQSGVAFWIPSERESLLASSSFIKILIIPTSLASQSIMSNIFTIPRKIAFGRILDCVIVFPHSQRSITSIDFTLFYSPNQLSQMVSIARGPSGSRNPNTFLMGPTNICTMASSFILSDNGYKLPIESQLLSYSFDEKIPHKQMVHINLSLMASVLCSKQFNEPEDFVLQVSEIESFFEWTFLSYRLNSNPSYYGWHNISILIRETLLLLDSYDAISFKKNADVITILPHCRLLALHSLSACTISKLDKELLPLWKK